MADDQGTNRIDSATNFESADLLLMLSLAKPCPLRKHGSGGYGTVLAVGTLKSSQNDPCNLRVLLATLVHPTFPSQEPVLAKTPSE